jgi:hypothetical protein
MTMTDLDNVRRLLALSSPSLPTVLFKNHDKGSIHSCPGGSIHSGGYGKLTEAVVVEEIFIQVFIFRFSQFCLLHFVVNKEDQDFVAVTDRGNVRHL